MDCENYVLSHGLSHIFSAVKACTFAIGSVRKPRRVVVLVLIFFPFFLFLVLFLSCSCSCVVVVA